MKNIFIVHGVGGHPGENWFPWLKMELEKENKRVLVPQFPTPANQTLTEWMKIVEQYRGYITPDTIVVGHSFPFR